MSSKPGRSVGRVNPQLCPAGQKGEEEGTAAAAAACFLFSDHQICRERSLPPPPPFGTRPLSCACQLQADGRRKEGGGEEGDIADSAGELIKQKSKNLYHSGVGRREGERTNGTFFGGALHTSCLTKKGGGRKRRTDLNFLWKRKEGHIFCRLE